MQIYPETYKKEIMVMIYIIYVLELYVEVYDNYHGHNYYYNK